MWYSLSTFRIQGISSHPSISIEVTGSPPEGLKKKQLKLCRILLQVLKVKQLFIILTVSTMRYLINSSFIDDNSCLFY